MSKRYYSIILLQSTQGKKTSNRTCWEKSLKKTQENGKVLWLKKWWISKPIFFRVQVVGWLNEVRAWRGPQRGTRGRRMLMQSLSRSSADGSGRRRRRRRGVSWEGTYDTFQESQRIGTISRKMPVVRSRGTILQAANLASTKNEANLQSGQNQGRGYRGKSTSWESNSASKKIGSRLTREGQLPRERVCFHSADEPIASKTDNWFPRKKYRYMEIYGSTPRYNELG